MEVQAILRNVRMSAQKMREVVRQVQGLPALHAQAVLAVVPRKGARVVAKTLKSAVANAEDLKEQYVDDMQLNAAAVLLRLMQLQSPLPNHAAIYIGDGQILHHLQGRLSSRDLYGLDSYYGKSTACVLRHESR